MIDKNLFIQDLKQVYTVLQELKVIEKIIEQLIDKYNLTNEELEEIKTYTDSIKEFIVQNNITTEIGGNLEVDGTIIANSTLLCNNDASIEGELSLPSFNNLVFNDGGKLIQVADFKSSTQMDEMFISKSNYGLYLFKVEGAYSAIENLVIINDKLTHNGYYNITLFYKSSPSSSFEELNITANLSENGLTLIYSGMISITPILLFN